MYATRVTKVDSGRRMSLWLWTAVYRSKLKIQGMGRFVSRCGRLTLFLCAYFAAPPLPGKRNGAKMETKKQKRRFGTEYKK
ncbi:MAG: hypothetical protein PUB63_04475, partial [Clostridia bacterium]|nr:hypothetical protein [Clostridia bacterium]